MGPRGQNDRSPGLIRHRDPDILFLRPGLGSDSGRGKKTHRRRERNRSLVGARIRRGPYDQDNVRGHSISKHSEIRISLVPFVFDPGHDALRWFDRIEGKESVEMVSIVISAYNEEKRIAGSLLETCAYMNDFGMKYEIIVVDDGSSDGTGRIVDHIAKDVGEVRLVRYEKNRGKGDELRTGGLVRRGDLILVRDADRW